MLLDGQPIGKWRKASLAHRRAVLPQHSSVAFDFTGRQIVRLGLLAHGSLSDRQKDAIAERTLAETEALAFADRPYTVLSGGERQRVQLARVLAQCDADPASRPFLLLDEPIAGLDSPTSMPRWPALAGVPNAGWACLPCLHDLTMAAHYADRVAILEAGRLTALGPAVATLDPALLSQVFATPILRLQAGATMAFVSPGATTPIEHNQTRFDRCYSTLRKQQRHRWANDPP